MAALATAACVVLHYFAAHHGVTGTVEWVQSHAQLVLAAGALVAAYVRCSIIHRNGNHSHAVLKKM